MNAIRCVRLILLILSNIFILSSLGQSNVIVSCPDDKDMVFKDMTLVISDVGKAPQPGDEDLASSLLLASDLKGEIEELPWYFDSEDVRKQKLGMEALLLTQGWSRYDLPKSLTGNVGEPDSYMEKGDFATGLVKSRWKGKALEDVSVQMIAPSIKYFGTTQTFSDGRFDITLPDLPEGTDFVVQTLNKRGGHEENFEVDEQRFPAANMLAPLYLDMSTRHNTFETDNIVRFINERGMNVILGDVTITAAALHGERDIFDILAARTFNLKEMAKEGVTTYEEVLRKIAGLVIRNGKVTFRSIFRGDSDVEFWVDGFLWESAADITEMDRDMPSTDLAKAREQIQSQGDAIDRTVTTHAQKAYGGLIPQDVAKQMISAQTDKLTEFSHAYPFEMIKEIQFFRPTEAAIFSVNAAAKGGVLLFTTKDGSDYEWARPWNLKLYSPLGYQPKREFYTPKYELMDEEELNARPTLYWLPRAEFDAEGRLSLPIPPSVSEAYVVVEGLTPDGTPVSYSEKVKR